MRTPDGRSLFLLAALIAASACGRPADPRLEPRGRSACVEPVTPIEAHLRPGDRVVDLRWCGAPRFPERGHWLPAEASADVVFDAFPRLGEGLGLVRISAAAGARDPGGWIHTRAEAWILDGVWTRGTTQRGSSQTSIPFTLDGGVVRIGDVTVRGPQAERAAVVPERRYLFVYTLAEGTAFPHVQVAWTVNDDGRVGAAVGGTRTRPWMRAFVGRPAREILDAFATRLARRAAP